MAEQWGVLWGPSPKNVLSGMTPSASGYGSVPVCWPTGTPVGIKTFQLRYDLDLKTIAEALYHAFTEDRK